MEWKQIERSHTPHEETVEDILDEVADFLKHMSKDLKEIVGIMKNRE